MFLLYAKLRASEIYFNYIADHLLLPHFKLFSKTKRGLQLVSLIYFLHNSWYILLTDKISLSGCLNSWDIGQYVYYSCLLTRLSCHKFWNLSYLSNQAVFSTWPKCHDKNLNTLRTKIAFKIKSIFHNF